MKLNPYSFEAHKKHMGLFEYCIGIENENAHLIEDIFSDELRKINARDKFFCYTCLCNEEVTQWKFAYSLEVNRLKARDCIHKEFKKSVASRIMTFDSYSLNVAKPTNNFGCECPFEGRK